MANKLNINNFDMFIESMKALSSAVEGIKVTVEKEQAKVLSKNPVARLKMTTNSISSDEEVSKRVKLLSLFNKE